MKKTIFHLLSIIIILTGWYAPSFANHLDGLWRNETLRITIRIEQEQNGFRAKRTDEGIWYHYSTQDNRYYTDQRGNWYEVIDNDQLIWNETKSDKRINFDRVDDRNYNSRNDYRNNDYSYNGNNNNYFNDYDHGNNQNNNGWYNDQNSVTHYSLEGNWFGRNEKEWIQIVYFYSGISVKTEHGGWERYYGDRSGTRFRDKEGNTIILFDNETLRYRGQHGKCDILFSRHPTMNRNAHEWKD
ncbi:MAG: hypothetical protein ABJC12_05425 [Saprospiraceae bacterium]